MDHHSLLLRMGITPNYTGHYQLLRALEVARREPDALLLVTKCLYPAVAKEFGTTWKAVERNIRSAISMAWSCNPALLSKLAGYPLSAKPRAAQFIAILSIAWEESDAPHL